jgi:uncharacterized protein
MSNDPEFITDATLGRLAKWLRLLGYDTTVYQAQADRAMLRIADAEKRIVLTRRQDMLERQFSGVLYLVINKNIDGQLREVITKFSLAIEKQKMFRICLQCNKWLLPVAREAVRDFVPSYVFANCTEYNKCPGCDSIYWAGTHQRNALLSLEKYIGKVY